MVYSKGSLSCVTKMMFDFNLGILFALSAFSVVYGTIPGFTDEKYSPRLQSPDIQMGDLKLTPAQSYAVKNKLSVSSSSTIFGYAAGNSAVKKWKNAIVPYEIDCSLKNMPQALKSIEDSMAEWESKTCIRFVPRDGHEDYLTFFRSTHCWSNVGNIGKTMLSIGDGCEYRHVMVHELGHAVGFWHEQNRPDRDNYVEVLWENIQSWVKDAFDIVNNVDSLGIQYDYESIMHYPWSAFTTNGNDTMRPRQRTKAQPYEHLSKLDVEQVTRMYNCPLRRGRRNVDGRKDEDIENRKRRSTGCIDSSHRCPELSKHGFCAFDSWTRANCQASCKVCTPATPTAGGCVDLSDRCFSLAKSGRCATDAWMKPNCKASCNLCGTTKPTPTTKDCTDKDPSCASWASAGYCSVDTVFPICQKSCEPKCRSGAKTNSPITTPIPTVTVLDCTDKDPSCSSWASAGYCSLDTVSPICKKSCDPQCKSGLTTKAPITTQTSPVIDCTDENPNCDSWARGGHCSVSTVFPVCRKTCHPKCTGGTTVQPQTQRQTTAPMTTKAPVFTRKPPITGGPCKDSKPTCPSLIAQCTTDSVRAACRLTCGICEIPKPCKDKRQSGLCQSWKSSCSTSTGVQEECPVTCKTCPEDKKNYVKTGTNFGKGKICTDENTRCPEFAKHGDCSIEGSYAQRSCLKSCQNPYCDITPPVPSGSCSRPLGLSLESPYPLPDSAFSSTSHLASGGWAALPENARLYKVDDHQNKTIGAWCAADRNDSHVQVDLGTRKQITSIVMQGRDRYFERVSKFKVALSDFNRDFKFIQSNRADMVFDGNCDHFTPVLNRFPSTVTARYIRVHPVESNFPCLRMELYGC